MPHCKLIAINMVCQEPPIGQEAIGDGQQCWFAAIAVAQYIGLLQLLFDAH